MINMAMREQNFLRQRVHFLQSAKDFLDLAAWVDDGRFARRIAHHQAAILRKSGDGQDI